MAEGKPYGGRAISGPQNATQDRKQSARDAVNQLVAQAKESK